MSGESTGRLAVVAVPDTGTAKPDVAPSKATWLRLGNYQAAEKGTLASNLPTSDTEPQGVFMRTNGAILVNVSEGGTWSMADGWSTRVAAATSGGTADATIDVAAGTALVAATGVMIYACGSAEAASAPASVFKSSAVADRLSGSVEDTVAIGASSKLSTKAQTTSITSKSANYLSTNGYTQTCDVLTTFASGSFFADADGTSVAGSGGPMVTIAPFGVAVVGSFITTAYAVTTQAVANASQTGYTGGIYLSKSQTGGATVRLHGVFRGQSVSDSGVAVARRNANLLVDQSYGTFSRDGGMSTAENFFDDML